MCYNDSIVKIMEKEKVKKTPSIFIVGLGNPGNKYQNTPHNAGFLVINKFARDFEFPEFAMEAEGILTTRKETLGKNIILAKPQMLMNNSGKALIKLFNYLKIRRKTLYPNLWIINDDLDIPLGKIKIAQNRGAAGHKGVQSIIDQLKTKNFVRFRIGIAPKTAAAKKITAQKYVLKKLSGKEQTEFDKSLRLAVAAIEMAIVKGIEKAATEHNQ